LVERNPVPAARLRCSNTSAARPAKSRQVTLKRGPAGAQLARRRRLVPWAFSSGSWLTIDVTVELLPQAPSTTIEIRVPRPALGDLVKEFNSDTTLYGETLTVELAEGKHHASETWREHVYTREENADRFDVQQRIWAQARAGKQSGAAPGDRAPRTRDEEAQLLLARPPAWEYLYFAAVLLRERDSLDTSWRDHEVAYTRPSGPNLDLRGAQRFVSSMLDEAVTIVENMNRLLTQESQDAAFGTPGEPGNEVRIEHLAERIVGIYGDLMDWATRARGARVPEAYRNLIEIESRYVDLPIRQFREFVDRAVTALDEIPPKLRAGEDVTLTLDLTVSVDEEVSEAFYRELARLTERAQRGELDFDG
jgi:hypothetical protein